ncbi:MAG TPA: FmdB family zinc ribbon protein [Longimicrobiales bacterium]
MPTYEYRCEKGHDFEQLQKMSDPPIDKCPVCGAPAERQLSAGAGLLFKGSGFYITDYRSENYRKAAESDKGTSGAAGGAAVPKADKAAGGEAAASGGGAAGGAGGSANAKSGTGGTTGSSGGSGSSGTGGAAGGPKA